MHTREKELQNLGLTEKEAKVYLASLELGEAPVQDIARKAGVNRATTYVMIEQLSAKGLMSSVERGKKRYFLAEAPDKLSTRVRLEITELEEKLSGFKRILPDLHSLYDTSGERPRVRFFEGEEGLLSIIEDFHETLEPGMEVRNVVNIDDYKKLFGGLNKHDAHKEKLRQIDTHLRQLYVSDSQHVTQLKEHHRATSECRGLPKDKFPIHGELTIAKNKIFLLTYTGKLIGLIIESEQIAQLLGVIFDLAWAQSESIKVSEYGKPRK